MASQPSKTSFTIDHTAYTFLLDRDGKFVILFPPGTPSERIEEILRELLSG